MENNIERLRAFLESVYPGSRLLTVKESECVQICTMIDDVTGKKTQYKVIMGGDCLSSDDTEYTMVIAEDSEVWGIQKIDS